MAAGEAYVGKTLTAGPGDVDDVDGLTNPVFSYVWTRVDADGESNPAQVGTAGTYTLVAADEGKKIKLEVSFTDDDSNHEARDVLFPSVGTVAPTPGADVVWATTMTVGEASGGRGVYDVNGAFVDDDFTHDGTSYDVTRFYAKDAGVYLDVGPHITLPDNLTLESAGEEFPMSASEPYLEVGHEWNQTWVAANASSLDADSYETTLPLGATVNVLLRVGNTPATGAPAVAGEAYVGRTIGAGPGTIADEDGLTSPGYSYVWTRVDADGQSNPLQVGTAGTYALAAADEGKKIKLEATFTDDASFSETREVLFPSVGTVDPTPGDDVVWATTMTVGESDDGGRGFARDSENFGSLQTRTFKIGSLNYSVAILSAGPFAGWDDNFQWVIVDVGENLANKDNYTLEFAGEEFPFSDDGPTSALSRADFTKSWTASNAPSLSEANYQNTLPDGGTVNVLLRRAPNNDATGAPAVAGAGFVGRTLTAGAGTIADEDGLTSPTYSYVWTRVDADGESNPVQVGTAGTYTLVAADEGRKIKLEASFTDDASYSEKRDVLFPSIGTVDPTPGDDVLWAATMTVGEHADGARGFDARTTSGGPFGSMSGTTFTHSSDDYTVQQLFAGEHSAYTSNTIWFVFVLDSRWADYEDYTLSLAGEDLDLDGASDISGTGFHRLYYSKTRTGNRAPSLGEDDYQTTLPVGATVNVLLQETPANPTVEFDAATYNVAEDADSVALTVNLSAAHTDEVTVDYATSDNTATAGQDYTARSGTLTFAAGDTEKTLYVPVTDDAVYEPTQRFAVTLSDPSGADLGTQSVAQVLIASDDAVPTATLADVSVAEGDGTMTLTLALSHLSELATTYQTSTSLVGGTATAGTDYTSFVPNAGLDFTVPAGDMSATLDITINDDAVPEADETITVSWALSGSGATPALLAFIGTITDNDPIVVGYDPVTYSVDEGDGPVVLTLKVLDPASGGAPRAFTVSTSTHEITTESPDDYNGISSELVQFSAGDTDKTHSITIHDDALTEQDETFGSAVTVFSGLATVKEDADTATVTIVDNDASTNNPATGSPAVSGAAYVGETLTAGPGDIADDDGLASPGYSYVWTRVDDDAENNPVQVGTAGTYTLVAADEGKKIKLEATFTDDGSNSEKRKVLFPSVGTVDPTPGDDVVWATTMTVGEGSQGGRGYDVSVEDEYVFGSVDDASFTVGTLDHFVEALFAGPSGAGAHTGTDWVAFELNTSPGSGTSLLADPGNYTLEFAGEEFPLSDATPHTFSASQVLDFTKAWVENNAPSLDGDNYEATLPVGATVNALLRSTANNAATGKPDITGTPQVGQTLTATAGDMDDADDLPTTTFPAGYTFRWVRVDGSDETEVGTNSHQYAPDADDIGKTIRVEVTFTDGGGTEETLPSDETVAVVREQEDCATDRAGSDWCATMTVGTWTIGTTNYAGFESGVSGGGQLDDADFQIGIYNVQVYLIYHNENQVALRTIESDPDRAVRDAVFDFGGTEFTADAGSEQEILGTEFNSWSRPANFTWIKGQKVTVSVKLPSSQNATGQPVVTGPAQVGMTLTADTTAIADADGLGTFSYQWIRGSTDIAGAESKTYVPVADDVGNALKVEVTFTDDADIDEEVTSEASSVVVPAAAENCSAAGTVWCTTVTVGHGTADTDGEFWLGFGGDVGTANEDFGSMEDSTFTIGTTEYRVTQVVTHTISDYVAFATSPELSGDAFTLHLQTIKGEASGAFSDAPLATNAIFDDRVRQFLILGGVNRPDSVTLLRGAYNRSNDPYDAPSDEGMQFAIRLSHNAAATGKPDITGPAQVGMELTAGTDDIADEDGLTGVSYEYQWIRLDSDGTSNPVTLTSETSSTYTLTSADLGKTLKVEVSFEDDADNAETLTSDATSPVVPAAAACGSSELWCAQMTVGYTEPDMEGLFNLGFGTGSNGHGTLTDSTFTHNSVDYDVTSVFAQNTDSEGAIYLATDPNLPGDGAGLTLHIQTLTGERDLPLSDHTLLASGIWLIDEGAYVIDLADVPMLRTYGPPLAADYRPVTDEGTVLRVRLTASSGIPEVEFDQINVNVSETADSVGLKVNLSAAHTAAVTVNYATSDNTAVAGEDYTSRSGTLTFDPGDTEKTIHVPILDDQSYGKVKRFNVTLSGPSGADLGTGDVAQVTISNDELVPTAWMEDVSVGEAAGTMTLTLRLSHPSELATRAIAFGATVGGTATEGTDYVSFITGSERALTVPAGDRSATLDITIIDDADAEDDETITIHWDLSGTDATPGAINFTGTILDDDSGNSPATGKPAISGTARVGETLAALTSGISDADGTAGASFRYQWVRVDADGVSNPVNVGADASSYTLAAADEGKRIRVRVTFTDDGGNAEGPLESDATATVQPPLPAVSFGAASYAAIEGGAGAEVTLELSAPLGAALTVPLTVTPQNGASSADYSGVPGSVTFHPGQREVSFTVTATDDGVDDSGESLRLDIGALPSGVTRGSPSSATVALVQEEVTVWYIYFDQPTYTATEGGADAELTVVLSAPWKPELNEALTILLSAPQHQGGATSADYSGVPESVTFAPGQTRTSFTVTATDDDVNDDGERFRLGFAAVSGNFPDGLTTGRGPHIVTVHLKDNDEERAVRVSFGARTYTAAEGGDAATVEVRLNAAPGRVVTVPLTTEHNGASSADYSGVPESVSFAASETSRTFDVTATDDAVDDDGESVTLGFGELPVSVSAGSPATTTVNLTDNDGEPPTVRTLRMDAHNSVIREVREGRSYNLTFSLDEAVDVAVSVPLEVEHTGGATSADYGGVPATITFERNERSTNVIVRAVQDTEEDDGEGFKVSFGTLPPGLRVDERYSVATFVIIDDDGLPGLSVSAIRSEYESASHLGFEVKLSEKAEQEVRVDYATRDGTAKAGEDYVAGSGTLVFSEGQELKRVWVELINDQEAEETEEFTLRLSNPVRAVLWDDTAVGRILDNDDRVPDPVVSVADASAAEGSPVAFAVSLSAASGEQVTVAYATSGGTATSGTDFTPASGTLTFAANETTKTVSVATTDDSSDEQDETFTLTLSSPTNATLGDATATGTIHDDDGALTARFANVPTVHTGAAFTFIVHFSADVAVSFRTLRDAAFDVTGGSVTRARRRTQGSSRDWNITVEPTSSSDPVTIKLPETTGDCSASGAICTSDGRKLSNSTTATVAPHSSSSSDEVADPVVSAEDADLALVAGLGPSEAAAVLFGEAELDSARLRALDRLGNGNGRYDLGDLISWRDRCRRGEADCGGTSGGAGGAAGAAALLAAGRGRGTSGRGAGRAPKPRGRTPKRRGRRRAKYLAGVLLAALAAGSCGDGSVELLAPPDPVPDPGFVTVEFAAPAARRDTGVLLELEGPGIGAVRAPGLEVYESGASGPRRVILAGLVEAGPLMQFHVPDRNGLALYRVRVVQVTGGDYGLRDAGEYRAAVGPR